MGRDRTFWKLSQNFYWPRMGKDVKDFVLSCESCQRNKSGKTKTGLLQPLPLPERPWADISMDLIVGLPLTEIGHDAIFTFVDRLTKYTHLIPTKSTITAEGAARVYIDHVYHPYTDLVRPLCQTGTRDSLPPSSRSCFPCWVLS